jgi:signal transduction histidine kinase
MAAQPAGRSHPASGERLQHLMDAADALRRVAGLVARRAAPHETLSAIAQELARFLGADFTSLLRYEPDGTAVMAGWWGASGVDVPPGTRLTVAGEDVAVSVLATGQPAWTDRFEGPAGSVAASFRRLGVRSAVGAPIILEGRLWGVAIAAASQPVRLPAGSEWRIAGLTDLVGAVIADTQARVDLQHVADEQAALRRVAVLVAGSASPAEVFSAVAGEVGALLGADIAIIARFEPDATATILAGVGARDPLAARWPVEPPLSIEAVFRTGHPARVDELRGLTGITADYVRQEGLRSTVAGPIHVGGRLWGAIVASSRRGPFPVGAEQRMADFTELVATAIANAESRAELVASRARIVAAFDRARRDLERDLHDGVQQRLVSLALMLRGAHKRVPPELPELNASLAQAAEGLAGVLSELQEISRGIHPAILSQGGLGPALKTLARRSAIPVELAVSATVSAAGRLPEPVEVAAYYVVAEALANVAKHARASVAYVDVRALDDAVSLRVRDDGVGGADPSRGSGLIGHNDRAQALGGTMRVDSPAGKGTTLLVTLPIAGLPDQQSR